MPDAVRWMIVLALCLSLPVAAAPANPGASARAKQILTYLQGLPAKSQNRVLSGQNAQVGSKATAGYTSFVEGLQQQTGKWVALVGIDYGYEVDPVQIKAVNQVARKHANAGGLVTISHHFANPFTDGDAWDTSGVNLSQLIQSGTAMNTKWLGWLDQLAAGLAELRDENIVVLWRPFHEMNGDWFWWSYSGSNPAPASQFVALWKHMFNYFTDTKKLDNLLWVYSPNAQISTDSTRSTTHYYPGSAFVDIVGLDYYRDDFSDFTNNGSYSSLVALGKPFAVTEFGPRDDRRGTFDNTVIIQGIKSKAPKAVYWLNWHSWPGASVAMVDCKNAATLLADPWVVTLDELTLGPPPADGGVQDAKLPGTEAGVDVDSGVRADHGTATDGNIRPADEAGCSCAVGAQGSGVRSGARPWAHAPRDWLLALMLLGLVAVFRAG